MRVLRGNKVTRKIASQRMNSLRVGKTHPREGNRLPYKRDLDPHARPKRSLVSKIWSAVTRNVSAAYLSPNLPKSMPGGRAFLSQFTVSGFRRGTSLRTIAPDRIKLSMLSIEHASESPNPVPLPTMGKGLGLGCRTESKENDHENRTTSAADRSVARRYRGCRAPRRTVRL
jgi:hypothetical protein